MMWKANENYETNQLKSEHRAGEALQILIRDAFMDGYKMSKRSALLLVYEKFQG